MAIRRLALRADPGAEHVSREAHVQAFMDLEAVMWFSGGVGSIVVNRERTEVEGEMVTTFGVIEWKDRTDARNQPEQAQQVADVAPPQQAAANALEALAAEIGIPAQEIVAALAQRAAGENGPQQHAGPEAELAAVAANGDGDGAREEPEEDVSSIPEHQR